MSRRSRSRALVAAACAATAAFAMPSSPASGAVSVGSSGWSWGSPLPQGNTLRSIELIGGRGYASGAFGTVLRTEDGGVSWMGLTTGVTADLDRLQLLGADSFVVGGGCVLRRSDDGGRSFKRLPFAAGEAACPAALASFSFPTPQTGYLALGDGTITRTDDGGDTFSRRTAVPETRAAGGGSAPTDLAFTGPDTGVAVTGGPQARIYRTTDGARSWTVVQSSGAGYRAVRFVDARNGYALGGNSELLATTDGGETWARRALAVDSPPTTLTGIRCADLDTCLISTEGGDRVFRTTDGGETARAVTLATDPVFAAAFANEARVVGVGARGTTVLSDDGGLNYRPTGGRLPGTYTAVRAASATVAYALGADGALARTADGGRSWTEGSVSTSEDVRDVSFPTADTGFALDTAGALLRTDNGGRSWRILNTGASQPPLAVLAPSPGVAVLVGPRGLRRSANGGEEFAPVPGRAVTRASLFAADRAGSALVAYGARAILLSGNGGRSWRALRRPTRQALRSVDFVTARTGYAVDGSGRMFRTRDGGRRWVELLGIGASNPFAISFGDATSGWATVPGFGGDEAGYLIRTDDGGATWRPQLVSSRRIPAGGFAEGQLAATGARSGLLLASDGRTPDATALFSTSSGGDAGAASRMTLRTSARMVRRGRTVRIDGRLAPAEGGETAVLYSRTRGRWTQEALRVASNGRFSTTRRLRATTVFVAQWRGDDDRRSDGTSVVGVRVRR